MALLAYRKCSNSIFKLKRVLVTFPLTFCVFNRWRRHVLLYLPIVHLKTRSSERTSFKNSLSPKMFRRDSNEKVEQRSCDRWRATASQFVL